MGGVNPPNRRSYSALRDYSLMLLLTYKLKSLRGVGGLVKNLGRQGNEYDQVSERTSSARAKEKEDTKPEWTRINLPRTLV